MTAQMAHGDVTLGEVVRRLDAMEQSFGAQLATLPERIGRDMDQRQEALRRELVAADEAVRLEAHAALTRLADQVKDIRNIVYGAVGFILIAVLAAVTEIVVHLPSPK